MFGYELGGPGFPTTLSAGRLPQTDGEAVASASDASAGYAIGQRLTVVPGDTPVTIVGLAKDIQFNVQPTLFVSYPTYETFVRATNPDATGVLPNLVGVEPVSGVDPTSLAASITQQVEGVEALDRATAVASLPGVSSIQQSFAIILGLAFVVVILLTGFFFLIITVQKTPSLTLLRAVGASGGFLLRNLVLQVLLVIGAALVIAVPLTVFAVSAASSDAFAAEDRSVGPVGHVRADRGPGRGRVGRRDAPRREDRSRGRDRTPGRRGARMKLAWRELVRRPSRFVTAGAALTLIVLLLLVLGGILDALVQSSTGLLKAQSAPLIVYSADSKGSIDRSRVSGADKAAIASVPGVHEATGLGLALVAGHIPGRSTPADVAVFGYEAPNLRVPAPPGPGEGYADRSLQDDGVSIGQTIELGSGADPGGGRRLGQRHGLQPPERPVGRRRHLAPHPEREHPRCGGRAGHLPGGAGHARGGDDARAARVGDRGEPCRPSPR